MSKPKCETCGYWAKPVELEAGKRAGCHRFPPSFAGRNPHAQWPRTWGEELCGEWKPAVEKETPMRAMCPKCRYLLDKEGAYEQAGKCPPCGERIR